MTTETTTRAAPPEQIKAVPVRHPGRWVAAGLIAVSSVAGAQFGAAVARRIPDRVLRAIVVTGGLTVGIVLAVR